VDGNSSMQLRATKSAMPPVRDPSAGMTGSEPRANALLLAADGGALVQTAASGQGLLAR
jgi:hypothetical protein